MTNLSKTFAVATLAVAAAMTTGCASTHQYGESTARDTYRSGGAVAGAGTGMILCRNLSGPALLGCMAVGGVAGAFAGDKIAPDCRLDQTITKTQAPDGTITKTTTETQKCSKDVQKMQPLP